MHCDRFYFNICYASFDEHYVINRITERNDTVRKNKFKVLTVAVVILLTAYLYVAVNNTQKGSDEEMYTILTNAITRSAVQCYAIEGFYPPDIAYLENNYGLVVNHDKYVVSYSVFASNIMPEIEVFIK